MMIDDFDTAKPRGALADLIAEDLDALSAAECDARIAVLTAEIARTEARRSVANAHRSHADQLFKK